MTTTLERWQGEFGDEYTARNRVDWLKRVPFWRSVIEDLKPESVLEVGCNAGWNLRAIRACNPEIELIGIEPNPNAYQEAKEAGFMVEDEMPEWDMPFDLVFTAGVLIHLPPKELPAMMRDIVDATKRYVICIEYEDDTVMEVKYRGEWGLLWKRPYGRLYEEMGLKVLGGAFLPPESGWDSCTYWLLEKPAVENGAQA